MMNEKTIENFLESVNQSFPVPLSQKQNLKLFSKKLLENGTLCVKITNNEIVSMVAGYTDNVVENMGYISIVATKDEAKGNGYASMLVKEFLDISRKKSLDAVHLYTSKNNLIALSMYKKIGFQRWLIENEERPEDIHLIYFIRG